jgi:hypothetical protein
MGPMCKEPYAWGFISVVFFIIFTVFGSLIMLNLFIGVIVTSMEEALVDFEAEEQCAKDIHNIVTEQQIPPLTVKTMSNAFELIDVDGSKCISVHELCLGLRRAKIEMEDDEIREVVEIMVRVPSSSKLI